MERIEFKVFTNMDSIVDFKELIEYAKKLGQKAIAITDYNSVESFPKIYKYMKKYNDFKIIYGSIVDVVQNDVSIPITVIVRNKIGLKNLYKIISKIKIDKVITKKDLVDLSDGLLYGLDTIYMSDIYDNLTDEQIKDDMMWYDFIEVKPKTVCNTTDEYLKRVSDIAKDIRKIVIATGDVHYVKKEEKDDYNLLYPSENNKFDRYLKSTKEMKSEFKSLSDDTLEDIVINNPNKLASLTLDIEIMSDKLYLPKIENSKELFINMVYDKAYMLYGNPLPDIVKSRIEEELYGKDNKSGIINNEYVTIYLVYKMLVEHSESLGYRVCPRGGVASSFLAYLIGITDINPLISHYRCSKCKKSIFTIDSCSCIDMPDKKCEKCNIDMIKDGFNIPYDMFLGYDVNKVPDIDMNFSPEVKKKVYNYLMDTFGNDSIVKAGVISPGKKVTGQHPGGIFIIPNDMDIYDFTPVAYPCDKKIDNFKITHFDYHDIKNIFKFDILECDMLTKIKKLEEKTKVKFMDVPLDDKSVMELFNKGEVEGIFDFDSDIARKLINIIKPKTFKDLIKVSALSHLDIDMNKETLITKDYIMTRDDILSYLIKHNIEAKKAYEMMDFIVKGKTDRLDLFKDELSKIDDDFVKILPNIKYIPYKSHIVSYVIFGYKLAWYKAHFNEDWEV